MTCATTSVRAAGDLVAPRAEEPEECGRGEQGCQLSHGREVESPSSDALVGGHHPEAPEYRGRGADRGVGRILEPGIGKVAEHACRKSSGPGEADPQGVGGQYTKGSAKDEVPDHVRRITMETQGRHGSPELAIGDLSLIHI